mmetsp:Transcript_10965/g.67848  ORF Transcript_10965/g.67848 Transcript_10965/m.67848 type:complete len:206 (+) Transcript_10965:2505-3122(+)
MHGLKILRKTVDWKRFRRCLRYRFTERWRCHLSWLYNWLMVVPSEMSVRFKPGSKSANCLRTSVSASLAFCSPTSITYSADKKLPPDSRVSQSMPPASFPPRRTTWLLFRPLDPTTIGLVRAVASIRMADIVVGTVAFAIDGPIPRGDEPRVSFPLKGKEREDRWTTMQPIGSATPASVRCCCQRSHGMCPKSLLLHVDGTQWHC